MKRINSLVLFSVMILAFLLIAIGVSSNFKVTNANGGKMPVKSIYNYETERHFTYQETEEINYPELSDKFKIRNWVWSIGDFFLAGGLLVLIICSYFHILNILDFKKGRLIINRIKKEEKRDGENNS